MEKQERIRVLQCVSNMDRAGIETMLMNFYRNIDRNKIQFDFLVNKSKPGDYDEEIKKMGGNIYVSPGLSPFNWFKYQKFLKNLFNEHKEYKIIHCQNEAMGLPALIAAKKRGIPVRISHSHNTTTRFDIKWPVKILYKKLIKKYATDYVACSQAAGTYFFNEDVKVINNAIDSDKFVFDNEIRKNIRNELKVNNKLVLGHVGRFEPQKNHEFLIKIFKDYTLLNENAILLLVGEGTLQKKIKEEVEALGLSNKVIFTGSVPNVNDYYQAMDLFLLPSFHEGLPVVGIEAQASGLKCLLSDKITKEVDICKNSTFIGIERTADWIKEIDKNKEYERKNMKKYLVNNNYDIKAASDALTEYYSKLYRGTK